jgi:hypothetical protein
MVTKNSASQHSPPIRGLGQVSGKPALPPVDKWNPPLCGHSEMRIARDGTWYYRGSPIGRKPLMRLFSSILRREANGSYVLVTPVEKLIIDVEDAPFLVVAMAVEGRDAAQVLTFQTNADDEVRADADHPLMFRIDSQTEEPSPYLHVRGGLNALLARPVFYELVDLATEHEVAGKKQFGVWSAGEFFAMMSADALRRAVRN